MIAIITYVVKVSLCLAIILGSYIFILEREKILKFNRYFLLLGLIAAHIVPLINNPLGVIKDEKLRSVGDVIITQTIQITSPNDVSENIIPLADTYSWMDYILFVYIIIATILLTKLAINILQFHL